MSSRLELKIKNVKLIIYENKEVVAKKAAAIFFKEIRKKPNIVLGLATGRTPIGLYKELVKMYKKGNLDFEKVITFNLDEYLGLPKNHPQSYRSFMERNFFKKINIKKENTFFPEPPGSSYEKKIKEKGGIDLLLLGIGRNGHIAFNEPGSEKNSRTRIVNLTKQTIKDNLGVSKKAVTMGIGTILEAKKIVLLACGKNKAGAIKKVLKGPISSKVPASFLQNHKNCTFILDQEAAKEL